MKRRFFSLAILVPQLLGAQETGIVRGRVTDAATGQPVAASLST